MLFHITADQLETAASRVRTETITPAHAVRVGHGIYRVGVRDASFRGVAAFIAELAVVVAEEEYDLALIDDVATERVVVAARLMGSVKAVKVGTVTYHAISVALREEDDETAEEDEDDGVFDDHAYDLAQDRAVA